jgi:cation diffusion facilitator CzcD-associated flavoprotein CzcO
MSEPDEIEIAIVGGGPGGIIALYYARQAGLRTILLEARDTVGGLWTQLPSWQDIQNREEDWTLGDIPIAGVDQASIAANIRQWVDTFNLGEYIRLKCPVLTASPVGGGWDIQTPSGTLRAKALISATGVHNRPFIPEIQRSDADILELHSSMLHDPNGLAGKAIVVVGGGASAFDLIDLCLEYGAARIVWVHRSLKWMAPTRKPKRFASNVRELAKRHMLGETGAQISAAIDADLRDRYHRFGMEELLPNACFNIERDQLIPGRWRLIANLSMIERHHDEVEAISGRSIVLRSGIAIDADVLLWGTGYEMDISYLGTVGLNEIVRPDQLARRCGSMVVSLDAPNLYFMSVGLESTSATPWHYAHLARTIVSQISGTAALSRAPVLKHLNYFGVPTFLASFDPASYPTDGWRDEYLALVTEFPNDRPLPIPQAKGLGLQLVTSCEAALR